MRKKTEHTLKNLTLVIGLGSLLAACAPESTEDKTVTQAPAAKLTPAAPMAVVETISQSALELGARAANWQL